MGDKGWASAPSLFIVLLATGLWTSPAQAGDNPSAPAKSVDFSAFTAADAASVADEKVNAMCGQDTLLCKAIADNHEAIAKAILQSPKVDVNKRGLYVDGFNNTWERTPLILAAKRGFTELVDILLSKGADINARDRSNGSPLDRGTSALMWASWGDHLETAKALFNHGKKPELEFRDRDGASALWLASDNESLGMIQFLVGKGVKVNIANNAGQSILTTTLVHKQFEVFDFLVAKGADINLTDASGISPLMNAILTSQAKRAGALRWLEHFLTCKPKLDLQQLKGEGSGDTALVLAGQFGFSEAINLLLDRGARIDLPSLGTKRTALAAASMSKQLEAAKLLMKRGANTEWADKSSFSPMLMAVAMVDADMVQTLLEGGAHPDFSAPAHPLTPLVFAAGNIDPTKHSKYMKIIRVLLEGKANINFKGSDGRTPLIAAAACSDPSQGLDAANLLLDKGADVNLANSKGETALMLAAGNGNDKMVKLLLKKDAEVQAKSGAGETALNFAQRSGKSAVITLLEAKGAKAGAAVALPKVLVKDLVGTWVGKQDGLPQAVFNLTLKPDNTFDFVSRFTPEALKALPKGSVNPVIAAQKGPYTLNGDILVLNVVGAPPFARKWKLEGGMLILDNIIRLKRTK